MRESRKNITLFFSVPSPELSGHKRRAAVKLSSSRKSAGHKTQTAADWFKNKQLCKPSGITEKRAVISTRASPRPRCGSGCFYSQINQTHLLSGGLSLSVRVLRWFLMETDGDWSPSLRPAPLWAEDTCGSASCSQSARVCALTDGGDGLSAQRQPGRAHSHSPPPLGPGPETGRTKERFQKRWKCFTGLQEEVLHRGPDSAVRQSA